MPTIIGIRIERVKVHRTGWAGKWDESGSLHMAREIPFAITVISRVKPVRYANVGVVEEERSDSRVVVTK